MNDSEDYGNPFQVPESWEQSSSCAFNFDNVLLTNIPILSDVEVKHQLPDLDVVNNSPTSYGNGVDAVESLVDLEPIEEEPLEGSEGLSSGSASFSAVDDEGLLFDNDVFWQEAGRLRVGPERRLQTWEQFYNEEGNDPHVAYVSESGAKIFNALMYTIETNTGIGASITLLPTPFLDSLTSLLHARDSRLFTYCSDRQGFTAVIPNSRVSGHTYESSQSLINTFAKYAANVKKLREMAQRIMTFKRPPMAVISLATATLRVISIIEHHYAAALKYATSLLHLQSLIERPSYITVHLLQLLGSTSRLVDVEVLSTIWNSILLLEETQSWMCPVMAVLLETISRPWSLAIDGVLGLPLKDMDRQYLGHNSATFLDAFPSWVETIHVEQIKDIAGDLDLIKKQQPSHPLAAATESREAVSLHTRFSIKDIDQIQSRATRYEVDMLATIRDFDSGKSVQKGTSSSKAAVNKPSDEFWDYPGKYLTGLDAEMSDHHNLLPSIHEGLEDAVLCAMNEASAEGSYDYTLPISLLLSLNYSSILTSQARLVNQACLRLLFVDHHLESHLTLQHRFLLLDDGVFASRLTHALFDTDLPSTERKKGHQRLGTSGLRLGERDTWPPASSELRLALSGILTECYETSNDHLPNLSVHGELPGNLGFSVRPMSEEALQRCMDPSNIEALDFLTLQYQAPEPVNAIMTASILAKYDLVFKQLLRCQRMLHTVKQLCHPGGIRGKSSSCHQSIYARRFRMEAHHFVVSMCGYFHDRIGDESRSLWARVHEMKTRVEAHALHEGEGLRNLRDFHEMIIDRILFALFLRKRQVEVVRLLEEIFSLILEFSREVQNDTPPSERVRQLYQALSKKIRTFMAVCKELSEKKDHAPVVSQCDGGSMLRQVLLTLNMNGYYER